MDNRSGFRELVVSIPPDAVIARIRGPITKRGWSWRDWVFSLRGPLEFRTRISKYRFSIYRSHNSLQTRTYGPMEPVLKGRVEPWGNGSRIEFTIRLVQPWWWWLAAAVAFLSVYAWGVRVRGFQRVFANVSLLALLVVIFIAVTSVIGIKQARSAREELHEFVDDLFADVRIVRV